MLFKNAGTKHRNYTLAFSPVPSTHYDQSIRHVQLPTELDRKPRRFIDCAQFKAQEWQNLTLFLWPLTIASILTSARRPQRQLLLLLTYIIRSYYIPEYEQFIQVPEDELHYVMVLFQKLHKEILSDRNQT